MIILLNYDSFLMGERGGGLEYGFFKGPFTSLQLNKLNRVARQDFCLTHWSLCIQYLDGKNQRHNDNYIIVIIRVTTHTHSLSSNLRGVGVQLQIVVTRFLHGRTLHCTHSSWMWKVIAKIIHGLWDHGLF